MSIEMLDCLKRKRDICIKNIIPSQNTAFRCPPPSEIGLGPSPQPILLQINSVSVYLYRPVNELGNRSPMTAENMNFRPGEGHKSSYYYKIIEMRVQALLLVDGCLLIGVCKYGCVSLQYGTVSVSSQSQHLRGQQSMLDDININSSEPLTNLKDSKIMW